MSKDQTYGAAILAASVVGIIIYAALLYAYALVVLQITAFIAVAGVLVIAAWIGYTMATTPPPAPIEVPEAAAAQTPTEPTVEKN